MTNRSFQETAELVIFALIAVLVGLAVLWVTGWIINLLGSLFMLVASFIWTLLRFILPVLVIAAVIYLIVRYATKGERRPASAGSVPPSPPRVGTASSSPAPAAPAAVSAEPRTVDAEPADTRPADTRTVDARVAETDSSEPRTVEAETAPRPATTEPTSELGEPPRRDPREPEER